MINFNIKNFILTSKFVNNKGLNQIPFRSQTLSEDKFVRSDDPERNKAEMVRARFISDQPITKSDIDDLDKLLSKNRFRLLGIDFNKQDKEKLLDKLVDFYNKNDLTSDMKEKNTLRKAFIEFIQPENVESKSNIRVAKLHEYLSIPVKVSSEPRIYPASELIFALLYLKDNSFSKEYSEKFNNLDNIINDNLTEIIDTLCDQIPKENCEKDHKIRQNIACELTRFLVETDLNGNEEIEPKIFCTISEIFSNESGLENKEQLYTTLLKLVDAALLKKIITLDQEFYRNNISDFLSLLGEWHFIINELRELNAQEIRKTFKCLHGSKH